MELERVTDPGHPTSATETAPVLVTTQTPRQKDPKKQAAGRAGAAARKAKEDKIRIDLRDAKAALKTTSNPSETPAAAARAPPETGESAGEPHHTGTRSRSEAAYLDWTPWIVGGLGVACALWVVVNVGTTREALTHTPMPTRARVGTTAAIPAGHLKASLDPFYMQ